MPYAVLEALACGLPVVGTDLPVQRRLLDVPSEPIAIAERIREVLSLGRTDRANHAAKARQRVEGSY